jgi:hypothetical protein
VGRRRAYLRRSRWDVVRVAVGTLIGLLVGFLVGLIGGSQEGEQAAPSAPRTVTVEKTVEKTIPVATPEPRPPDTTTARPPDKPPDKPPGKPPEKDKPPDTSTSTATATATATAYVVMIELACHTRTASTQPLAAWSMNASGSMLLTVAVQPLLRPLPDHLAKPWGPFLSLFTRVRGETVWKIAEGVSPRLAGGKGRPNRDSFEPFWPLSEPSFRNYSEFPKHFRKGCSRK